MVHWTTGDPGVFLADLQSESRFLGGPGGRIVGKPDASSAGMSGRWCGRRPNSSTVSESKILNYVWVPGLKKLYGECNVFGGEDNDNRKFHVGEDEETWRI